MALPQGAQSAPPDVSHSELRNDDTLVTKLALPGRAGGRVTEFRCRRSGPASLTSRDTNGLHGVADGRYDPIADW